MREEVLRMERVTQIMGGVTLLDNVSLHIFKGEIMGLLCLNAHGQDALMDLLCQNLPIHYGYVFFQDVQVNHYEHSSLRLNRISVIEERSRLVEDLTVADNIFVLRRGFKKYLINARILNSQLFQYIDELGISIRPGDLVGSLTFFQRCVVELLKAVITGDKLVIVRDVSNFISAADLKKFYELLRLYAQKGTAFLYICNHHEEAFAICHRVSIMENGRVLRVLAQKDFQDESLAPYILDFSRRATSSVTKTGDDGVLKFDRVCTGQIHNLSFIIERGECVVLMDVNNTVFPDIFRLMNGEMLPDSGSILVKGEPFGGRRAKYAREVALIRDNPLQTMLFPELNYIDNLCFLLDKKMSFLWRDATVKKSVVQEYEPVIGDAIHSGDIRGLPPSSLYDLVYYRIHLLHPEVVFCLQPFSGADMYLRHHLVGLINQLRQKGIAVVILAVSISDSLAVADRLLIVQQGELNEEYHSDQFHYFDSEKTPGVDHHS